MDTQKQPPTSNSKTGTGVQPAQPQQQRSNIPQDKQATPAGGNQSPLKEGNASANRDQKRSDL